MPSGAARKRRAKAKAKAAAAKEAAAKSAAAWNAPAPAQSANNGSGGSGVAPRSGSTTSSAASASASAAAKSRSRSRHSVSTRSRSRTSDGESESGSSSSGSGSGSSDEETDEDEDDDADSEEESSGSEEDERDYRKGGYHVVKPGDLFKGRYEVLCKLGWGHFSTVWLVQDYQNPEPVTPAGLTLRALKIVKSAKNYTEAARDEIQICEALSEGDAAGRRHVVQLLDQFDHKGPNGTHACVVFELLGSNLLDLIKRYNYRGAPLPIVKSITKQLLVALDFLRERGVIHTDLKPENVLLYRRLPRAARKQQDPAHDDALRYSTAIRPGDHDHSEKAYEAPEGGLTASGAVLTPGGTLMTASTAMAIAPLSDDEDGDDDDSSSGRSSPASAAFAGSSAGAAAAASSSAAANSSSSSRSATPERGGAAAKAMAAAAAARAAEEEAKGGDDDDNDDGAEGGGEQPGLVGAMVNAAARLLGLSDDDPTASVVSGGSVVAPGSGAAAAAGGPSSSGRGSPAPGTPPPPQQHAATTQTERVLAEHGLGAMDVDVSEAATYRVKLADFGNACWTHKHFTNDVQTRQYRSPEIVLGARWGPSIDWWSLAAMAFELATGDMLFEPKQSRSFAKDDDHLAQMIELLGQFPRKMTQPAYAHNARRFFRGGKLKAISNLKMWPLERVLVDKYKFDPAEAESFADFLEQMLRLDPETRVPPAQLLSHRWLADAPMPEDDDLDGDDDGGGDQVEKAEDDNRKQDQPAAPAAATAAAAAAAEGR